MRPGPRVDILSAVAPNDGGRYGGCGNACLQPGTLVILNEVPASLLGGLAAEDQTAIEVIVGRPVVLAGFSYGQAELEFTDSSGDDHTIWVEPDLIRPAQDSE